MYVTPEDENGLGCCPPGLAGYMGADDVPWWQQLLQTGGQIATTVLQPRPPQYPTYTTPPYFPTVPGGLPTQSGYGGPVLSATETNWTPYLIAAAAVVFFLFQQPTRRVGRRRRR